MNIFLWLYNSYFRYNTGSQNFTPILCKVAVFPYHSPILCYIRLLPKRSFIKYGNATSIQPKHRRMRAGFIGENLFVHSLSKSLSFVRSSNRTEDNSLSNLIILFKSSRSSKLKKHWRFAFLYPEDWNSLFSSIKCI